MLNIEVHSENTPVQGPHISIGVNAKYKSAALFIENKGETDITLSAKLDEEIIDSLIEALSFAKQNIKWHK